MILSLQKGSALLAPMSGLTDVAFRMLCKRYGAALTYTEFVHSRAVTSGNERTQDMLRLDPFEHPVGVQLFGYSVQDVVDAAVHVENIGFDVIDMNCGCPAHKVVKTGAGSALLAHPEQIEDVVRSIKRCVRVPVTVKIRTGIDSNHINAVDVARLAESAGAAAITVHGRTQKQGYRGNADWNVITTVKRAVSIPVVGNGDVTSPEVFKQRLDESKVDAIMIGRAALGNPAIFKQINQYMRTGSYQEVSRKEIVHTYLDLATTYDSSLLSMKQHLIDFTKGMHNAATVRQKLVACRTKKEMLSFVSQYF